MSSGSSFGYISGGAAMRVLQVGDGILFQPQITNNNWAARSS
jgi:hypothetical protein